MRKQCIEDGCERPATGQGYCKVHYGRRRRRGLLQLLPVPTTLERFLVFIEVTEACWLWTGSNSGKGYGWFKDGKGTLAHRYSYEHFVGPIPEGLTIDHLCRVRRCVNPDHLEAVTLRENLMRGISPAAQCYRRTSCKYGHEYNETNTQFLDNGWRICRPCNARRLRELRKRRSANANITSSATT